MAKAYYTKMAPVFPELFDRMGEVLGVPADPADPGTGFLRALSALMEETGAVDLAMSSFGLNPADFPRVADITVDVTGIDWDRHVMSKADLVEVLEKSYR